VRFSVLVNGSPSGFFNSFRGLRQGDPLSPLLFVVVMEALSKMFSVTVDSGRLSGFSVGSRLPVVNISHLLFADDTLVFCEANPSYLCVLLLCFKAVSGLKVNLAKSLLVPVGNVDNAVKLVVILGCGTSSLPLKYLGMPLEACYKAKSIWDVSWLRWSVAWPVGKCCICPRVGGLPLSRVLSPTFLHTCLSFPFLLAWPIALRSSNETFYGVR
jgi:hypothetical protein